MEPALQRLVNDMFQERGEDALLSTGKLHVEFDETSELQRVRFGASTADAVFSVLVPGQFWKDVGMSCKLH